MMRPNRISRLAGSAIVAVSLATAAAAQTPRLTNGKVTTQTAGSPLAQSFRTLVGAQADVSWIGYSVPVVEGERNMCCFDSNSGTSYSSRQDGTAAAPAASSLEPRSAPSGPFSRRRPPVRSSWRGRTA